MYTSSEVGLHIWDKLLMQHLSNPYLAAIKPVDPWHLRCHSSCHQHHIYSSFMPFRLLLRLNLFLCLLLFTSGWTQKIPHWDVLLMGFDIFIFLFDWQAKVNYLPLLSPSISTSLFLSFSPSIYLSVSRRTDISGIETEMLFKWGDALGWSLFIVSFDGTASTGNVLWVRANWEQANLYSQKLCRSTANFHIHLKFCLLSINLRLYRIYDQVGTTKILTFL